MSTNVKRLFKKPKVFSHIPGVSVEEFNLIVQKSRPIWHKKIEKLKKGFRAPLWFRIIRETHFMPVDILPHLRSCAYNAKQCILVIIGATSESKKELVGFLDGYRESAQSWHELLLDLKDRGISIAPKLAIGDGALGFWKAWKRSGYKRKCKRVHKTANGVAPMTLSTSDLGDPRLY